MKAIEIINKLPFELAERLRSDDYFCDVPVAIADEGDVAIELAKRQAIATGLAVIVLQVVADDDEDNLQFGPMTLSPAFQVFESVPINRGPQGTGKPARVVARRIRDVIKSLGLVGFITTIKSGKPCILPVTNHDYANVVMYQVNFSTLEKFDEVQSIAQTPQFAAVGQTVQITCATAGAVIYYTTDDSYPRQGNANAPVYANPIAVPANGFILRAAAYAPPAIPSSVQRACINLT